MCAILRAFAVVVDLLPGELRTLVVFDEDKSYSRNVFPCFMLVVSTEDRVNNMKTVGRIFLFFL